MKLVGTPLSRRTRRVAVTLKLLKIEFESVDIDALPAHGRMHLYGRLGALPILVLDDGDVVVDSASIVEFIHEEVGPGRALTPGSGAHRRAILRYVGIGLAIDEKLRTISDEHARPEASRSQTVLDIAAEQMLIGFRMIEQEVGLRWMVGSKVSQADIVTAITYQSASRDVAPELVNGRSFPRLAAHAKRAMELDAFASTLPPKMPG